MKILVANRGEIAIRIMRTCKEMGLQSVAVFSGADENALHVRYADESVCIGPADAAQSYLNIPAVLQAAIETGANAIHPGYGFLSENADFAREVEEAGMIFIGPAPEVIALTGNKLEARRVAQEAGLSVISGSSQPLGEEIPLELANQIRYPILIKAVSGGGGRGIRLATSAGQLENMISAARKEAKAAFGDGQVYLEHLVKSARHIEIQVLGDGQGNILCLGERECSIQRRRQKLIEEAPVPGLRDDQRNRMYEDALRLAKVLNYRSLGTIEFLMDSSGDYYFIEVNPRIQVEHPVTEMVTNIDLVAAQLQLAIDGKLSYAQENIEMQGWAIEARVIAEDPENDFLPATGTIEYLKEPGGPGLRVDSALYTGMPVNSNYDSLLAKVIGWGEDRQHALRRLKRGLYEFRIGGVANDIDFLTQVISSDSFIGGTADTTYLDHFIHIPVRPEGIIDEEVALAAALVAYYNNVDEEKKHELPTNMWRMAAWREQMTGKD
jgi:acetyl-CoA carboxylase biotin carboxylase subunit